MVSKVNAPGVGGGQTSPKRCAETHTRGRLNAYLRPPSRQAGIMLRLVKDLGDRIGRGAGPQLRSTRVIAGDSGGGPREAYQGRGDPASWVACLRPTLVQDISDALQIVG